MLALKEKHAARAEHFSTIGRSLIGFAQVIGNLSGVRVEWPADFRSLSSWLRYLQIGIDVPSVACVISQSLEYTFFKRLLVYTLGPWRSSCCWRSHYSGQRRRSRTRRLALSCGSCSSEPHYSCSSCSALLYARPEFTSSC